VSAQSSSAVVGEQLLEVGWLQRHLPPPALVAKLGCLERAVLRAPAQQSACVPNAQTDPYACLSCGPPAHLHVGLVALPNHLWVLLRRLVLLLYNGRGHRRGAVPDGHVAPLPVLLQEAVAPEIPRREVTGPHVPRRERGAGGGFTCCAGTLGRLTGRPASPTN
jgi:hypothetical protein